MFPLLVMWQDGFLWALHSLCSFPLSTLERDEKAGLLTYCPKDLQEPINIGWTEIGLGAWVAQSIKHLPSAQVMIPGSWDRALHQAPCSVGGLLLPLPLPNPLAHALSLR